MTTTLMSDQTDRLTSPAEPPPTASRWSGAVRRFGALARTHWLFLIVFGVGAVGRLLTMIAYPPAMMYIDSYRYLTNSYALNPYGMEPIGYSLFLHFMLQHGGLGLVALVQHALGLGMGLCIYLMLRRRGVPKTLCVLASAPILLDAYQWQIEQNILSDTLFLAMITAALVLLTLQRRPTAKLAAAAGLVLSFAVVVRLVGEITIAPALLFVVLAAGPTWRRKLQVCGALALAFVIPVVGYEGYAQIYGGGAASAAQTESDNNLLYGRAATFANCSTIPARFKAICPSGTVAEREAIGPDFYANQAPYPVPTDLMHPFAYYVFEHQPQDLARAVGRDMLQLFISPRQTTFGGTDITRWQFQTTYPLWTAGPPPAVQILQRMNETTQGVNQGVARVLIDYQQNGGYTPGWLFAAFLLLGLFGAAGLTRGARRSKHRLECLLWITTALCLLLFADVFEFSWRYQLPALVLLPVAGVLGLCALMGLEKAPRPKLAAYPDEVDAAAAADFHERYEAQELSAPVFVVIAAYNEENGIGGVLDSLPAECHGMPLRPLVVVDGASDGTAEAAMAHGALTCVAPVNRGQGAALRLGYQIASEAGAKYVVTTDADGQYDAAELPALLQPLLDGEADFVTGSRVLGQSETGDHVRQLGCRVFAGIVSFLMRTKVTDTSFGLRAMRADVPVSLTMEQPQYQSSELLIGVISHGYRVAELPMTIAARGAGETKKGNNLVYGLRYARVVFGTWWRELRKGPGRRADETESQRVGVDGA
jgi:Glycosyl transferase family 2